MRTTQASNRAILGYFARQWGYLSDAQRLAWKNWATSHPVQNSLGQTIVLSGINVYTKLNSIARRLGGTGVENASPPLADLDFSVNDFVAATGAANAGDVDLTWSVENTGDADDFVEIRIAGPFDSPARVEIHNRYRSESTVAGNIELVTVAGLTEGNWYWFGARYVGADGQVSAWQAAQATPKLTV